VRAEFHRLKKELKWYIGERYIEKIAVAHVVTLSD
jgi:hypothetical protein